MFALSLLEPEEDPEEDEEGEFDDIKLIEIGDGSGMEGQDGEWSFQEGEVTLVLTVSSGDLLLFLFQDGKGGGDR